MPFVLRKCGHWYKLIGECYIAGIMNGEFVDLCERYKSPQGCPEEEEFELR